MRRGESWAEHRAMKAAQPSLFPPIPDRIEMPAREPNPVKCEIERRENQADRILERLKRGPARNTELVQIAMNLTARISDLRLKRGYEITAERVGDHGEYEYRLIGSGSAVPTPEGPISE